MIEKLVEACQLLDSVYWRQSDYGGLQVYKTTRDATSKSLLGVMGGRWDLLDGNHFFLGEMPQPPGREWYPHDLTRAKLDEYLRPAPRGQGRNLRSLHGGEAAGRPAGGRKYHEAIRGVLRPEGGRARQQNGGQPKISRHSLHPSLRRQRLRPRTERLSAARPARLGQSAPASPPRPVRPGRSAPASQPRPVRPGQFAPASSPRPVSPGQSAPASSPRPVRPGQFAPASSPRPVRPGQFAPASSPRPVRPGQSAPASQPRPVRPGQFAPANSSRPVRSGQSAPASQPRPVRPGQSAPASPPRPVRPGQSAPASPPRPVRPGQSAPASPPRPVRSGQSAPASQPRPVRPGHPRHLAKPAASFQFIDSAPQDPNSSGARGRRRSPAARRRAPFRNYGYILALPN